MPNEQPQTANDGICNRSSFRFCYLGCCIGVCAAMTLPPHMEYALDKLGVVRVSKHTPVKWPKKPVETGWKPSGEDTEPPF